MNFGYAEEETVGIRPTWYFPGRGSEWYWNGKRSKTDTPPTAMSSMSCYNDLIVGVWKIGLFMQTM